MKVEVEIENVDVENERGRSVPGVKATCSKCGHETFSFGTSEGSMKRCLVLLREECPENEVNFYTSEDV